VTIPSAEHLFEQAEQLIRLAGSRRPRQVDLRRAVSAAYYGVFHATLTATADHFIGVAARSTPRYALVYRSIDHRTLRDLCLEIQKTAPRATYRQYVPANGFGSNIVAFAQAVVDLQERRNAADYDPLAIFKVSDARFAVDLGRNALRRFLRASGSRRTAFLCLLSFSPR
jgi:hypothetical protein